ncbi:phage tail tube protein [Vreelandella sp. EE22]
MTVPLLERKKALLAGIETDYGKAVAPEDCSLMLVTELSASPYEGNTVERTRLREHLGGYAQINTGPTVQLQVTVPWSGSGKVPGEGTELTAPMIGKLLRGCKMRETLDVDAGEIQYDRISGEGDSLTLYYRHDGQQQRIRGSRGTVTGTGNTGAMPTVSFTFTGLYERPEVVEALDLVIEDWADELPVNFQNTTKFNIHGYEAIGQNFSVDLANTVTPRNLVNYEGIHVTDSTPTGQVSFQAPRLDEFDVFERIESHKVVATAPIGWEHGTQPGNIVGIRGRKAQLTGVSNQDSDGITHYQCDVRYLPELGDDEQTWYFK